MGEQTDPDQRRDKLLLRLLKTPPQSRAETSEQVRRSKRKKVTWARPKRATEGKPAPTA